MLDFGYVKVRCSNCRRDMEVCNSHGHNKNDGNYIMCKNISCGMFGKIFKQPTIELEAL